MAYTEDLPFELAQTGTERHVEALEDKLAQHIGVMPRRHQHRGQRATVLRRVGTQQLQTPGLHRPPRGLRMAIMAREYALEAFIE